MSKLQKTLTQLGLVILILVLGVAMAKVLIKMKKPPQKKEQVVLAPLLNAVAVSPDTTRMTVRGSGTVQARMEVQVVPQVSGKVVECNPQLVNGGFFKAHEPLVKIEQTDYTLAVESAAATVAQAEVQLEREKAEADVAKKEWQKLKPGEEPDSVLVFRGPQIRNARAQLKAAQARLAKAELDLERTTLKMPFDGRVVSTHIDIGQYITIGAPVATVYRTDIVEIVVPLEDSELAWFDVPMDGNGDSASKSFAAVDVFTNFAGSEHHWQGRLTRTEGRIDARSRMVHVVVQVDDPFKTKAGQPPLVPGMFVHVDIQGKQVTSLSRVPRYAIRNGNTVWLAVNESPSGNASAGDTMKLVIKPVKILRMDRTSAYVSEGLQAGDRVVTSPLETVTDGMAIRINMLERSENRQEHDGEF